MFLEEMRIGTTRLEANLGGLKTTHELTQQSHLHDVTLKISLKQCKKSYAYAYSLILAKCLLVAE